MKHLPKYIYIQATETEIVTEMGDFSYSTWNIESKCYNRGAIDGCSQTNIRLSYRENM
jgi:hypothetical protein